MDQTFSSFQDEMTNRMTRGGNNDNKVSEAATALNSSAKQLSSASSNQVIQTSALVQGIQQQSYQIQSLTMQVQSLLSQQRMASIPQPPPPMGMQAPAFPNVMHTGGSIGNLYNSAGNIASSGYRAISPIIAQAGGMAGSYAANRIGQYRNNFSAGIHNLTHSRGMAQPGLSPGFLSVPNTGMAASLYHGSGLSWNPAAAQGYTFGAYQRAHQDNFARSSASYMHGGMSLASSMVSPSSVLAMAAGAAGGPLGGLAAGMLLPMTGMDRLSPLNFGLEEMNRASHFGRAANLHSERFLRGAGARSGNFSAREELRAGMGVSKTMFKDLSMTNEDISSLQSDFAESGLMLGTNNASQYVSKFRKLIDQTKTIAKALQMTNREAAGFMATAFNEIGVNPGNTMSMMATRAVAGSHIAGISTQEMAGIMAQGAKSGLGYGLLGPTGALTAASGRMLAGTAATMGDVGGISTQLLASVGGEDGLGGLLSKAQNQFLGGVGGTLMMKGGSGDVFQRMGQIGSNMGGTGGMIGFMANRHTGINKLMERSPELAQMETLKMLSDAADKFGGNGASKKDTMKMLAQSMYGMSPMEADALIQSAGSMPENMRRQRLVGNQSRSDLIYDNIAENRGISAQVKLFGRELVGEKMGGQYITQKMGGFMDYGMGVSERMYQAAGDAFYDVGERSILGEDMAEKIKKNGTINSLGKLSQGSSANSELGDRINSLNAGLRGGDDGASILKDSLVSAANRGDVRGMLQAVKGINIGAKSELEIGSLNTSGVNKKDVMQVLRGLGKNVDKDTLSKASKSLGIDDQSLGAMTSEADLSKMGRDLFGLGADYTNEDVNYLMDSDLVQKVIDNIDQALSAFDFTKGKSDQSKDYRFKKLIADKSMEELGKKDAKSQNEVIKILANKGVKWNGTSFDVDVEAIENEFKKTSVGGLIRYEDRQKMGFNAKTGKSGNFETFKGRSGIKGKYDKQRMVKESRTSLKKGLTGIVGMDSSIASALTEGDSINIGDISQSIYDELKQKQLSDPGSIQDMIENGNEYESKLAQAFLAKDTQKNGKFSEKASSMIVNSLVNAGLDSRVGATTFQNEDLDPRVVGVATVKEMQTMTHINQATLAAMQKIVEDLERK